VGLLGVECRCGFVYCNFHRLPEDHSCHFDHAEAGKRKLEREIVKVEHSKVAKI
jgi:predicted nucleic acid binding AN1-type Zn finger protein